ncbi:hypothetical protein, partial [Pseudomonas syringae]|uniref:hypothetical protein n=1 Tax=Pseudomonas syringae TaxID=317 RepID=UPI001C5582C5
RNAKQGRQVEKNRLGNEDGANGLIVQRLLSVSDFYINSVGLFSALRKTLISPTHRGYTQVLERPE